MIYAVTINKNHSFYDNDIDQLAQKLMSETQATYVEIVNHANDHYHALIDTQMLFDKDNMPMSNMHYELIRNVKAYQKYMINHDLIDHVKYGELGYYEKPNNDDMINYAISYGLEKTVMKYGYQAIRVYKQLKEFLTDYKNK